MTPEFDRWLWAQRWQPPLATRGRWVHFKKTHGLVMGHPVYKVYAIPQGGVVHGSSLWIGRIEYRNQWRQFAFYPDRGVMFNKEILAEIYAMLRDLDRGMRVEAE